MHKLTKLTNKNKTVLAIFAIITIFVVYIVAVSLSFNSLSKTYKNDIINDSASHLLDINSQIKLLVEEDSAMARNATKSISHSILSYKESDADNV